MNILITGASGFIGTNLITYLERELPGVHITTLGRNTSSADHTWDTLRLDDLAGTDAILHLAGKAHDTGNTSAAEEYFAINSGLTKKLFDLYLQSGAGKFIYISSVKAAADTVAGILKETAPADPRTPYGLSKLQAENYIREAASANERKGVSGKQYYILRPCMVHGPGNKGNLNLLYQFAKRGIPYPLAAFDNSRSFLGVDNLCFIIEQILSRPVPTGVYQVADDEAIATTELIRLMAMAENRQPRLLKIPRPLVKAMAGVGDMAGLPLNSERLKKLTESYVVSNEKIRQALKLSQMPVSTRVGLLKTIQSFRSPGVTAASVNL